MALMTYIEAITDGLRTALKKDPDVILLGEDIGVYGGAFKATKGLFDEFGRDRVLDTPICESAFIGACIGMALQGFKPVAEIQFSDFVTSCFNQIVNGAAKLHYRWGGRVNMTVRLPTGGGISAGPFHSQNTEAWFLHVPGLKLVTPATPAEAKGLLLSAIDDPNPVLFFEHKKLYRSVKGEVPSGHYLTPIGKADLKREGQDITCICYGSTVLMALDAADNLTKQGIEMEVLDLRTLLPFDKEAILKSVRKTNRVLITHEAPLTGGVGAEISAFISQNAFEYLDAPIERVTALDTMVPYSPILEEKFLPNAEKITQTALKLLKF